MRCEKESLLLYAVTDPTWLKNRSLASCVAEAISGGVTFVQLRQKDASTDELVEIGKTILPLCRHAGVPFVIDDDVEAAYRLCADGVHIGQSDATCSAARKRLGNDAIIGVSAGSVEEALLAQSTGADYVGCGAIFDTATKADAETIGLSTLAEICAVTDIPVVAIGGLNASNSTELAGTGVAGAAFVSAIFSADDISRACRDLHATLKRCL